VPVADGLQAVLELDGTQAVLELDGTHIARHAAQIHPDR
jgi:hypothetical protein